jgi:hypothetical protein
VIIMNRQLISARLGPLLAPAAFFILVCFNLAPTAAQTASPKLTAAEWQADLRFMVERMAQQHPSLYRRIKKEEFDTAVEQFYARIPTLSEDEIITGFMRVVALVHDGHTSFVPRPYLRSGIFPVRFYQYSEGLFIQQSSPEYRGLVGAKVLKIGAVSADGALKLAGQLAFADNQMGIRDQAPLLLSIPEVLSGLKINGDKQSLSLVVQTGGAEKTVQLKPELDLHQLFEPPADWISADAAATAPLYRKHPGDLYWFEYLKDQKLLYVKQDAVQNKPDESVSAFYQRVMAFAAANPVDKFVLDLRNNGGGNNGLNRPVVIGLVKSNLDQRGRLFVITGRQTFSAAQNFVNELEKYTNAIFVGEPTAGHPNHYGDNRPITLPNSKLEVRVSTLYWQDMDPRDGRSWTAPEIAVALSAEDFRQGRDPALQAVIDFVPGSSFGEILNQASTAPDLRAFIAKYRAFKNDPRHRFIETETPMNSFGYTLLQNKRGRRGRGLQAQRGVLSGLGQRFRQPRRRLPSRRRSRGGDQELRESTQHRSDLPVLAQLAQEIAIRPIR